MAGGSGHLFKNVGQKPVLLVVALVHRLEPLALKLLLFVFRYPIAAQLRVLHLRFVPLSLLPDLAKVLLPKPFHQLRLERRIFFLGGIDFLHAIAGIQGNLIL